VPNQTKTVGPLTEFSQPLVSNSATGQNSPAGGKYDLACQNEHYGTYLVWEVSATHAVVSSLLYDIFTNGTNYWVYLHPFIGTNLTAETEFMLAPSAPPGTPSSGSWLVYSCNSAGVCANQVSCGSLCGGCTPTASYSQGSYGAGLSLDECATSVLIGDMKAGAVVATAVAFIAGLVFPPAGVIAGAVAAALGIGWAWMYYIDQLGGFNGDWAAYYTVWFCLPFWGCTVLVEIPIGIWDNPVWSGW
jgi:hypothetical protein